MTHTHPHPVPTRQPTRAVRQIGYLIAAGVDVLVLYLLNAEPGWRSVSFVTEDASRVMVLVNLSLFAGLLTNVLLLGNDVPWVKLLGDLVTTTVGLLAVVKVWQVFPFEFAGTGFDWALLVRILLMVMMVGTAIGMVVALARLLLEPTDNSR